MQKDQLQILNSEITTLFDQLETVRKEKHEVEEDRAANAKQRDKEVSKDSTIPGGRICNLG